MFEITTTPCDLPPHRWNFHFLPPPLVLMDLLISRMRLKSPLSLFTAAVVTTVVLKSNNTPPWSSLHTFLPSHCLSLRHPHVHAHMQEGGPCRRRLLVSVMICCIHATADSVLMLRTPLHSPRKINLIVPNSPTQAAEPVTAAPIDRGSEREGCSSG